MTRLIQFRAQFSGTIEVDPDQYPDWSDEDILAHQSHEDLFAACETDLDLDVEQ